MDNSTLKKLNYILYIYSRITLMIVLMVLLVALQYWIMARLIPKIGDKRIEKVMGIMLICVN